MSLSKTKIIRYFLLFLMAWGLLLFVGGGFIAASSPYGNATNAFLSGGLMLWLIPQAWLSIGKCTGSDLPYFLTIGGVLVLLTANLLRCAYFTLERRYFIASIISLSIFFLYPLILGLVAGLTGIINYCGP